MAGARGMWIMAGMSLNGYGGAGGMGKLMAEWIIDGEAPMDVYGYRATRFGNYYSDFNYAAERTVEAVKYYYRMSPVHYRLIENGAVFGEKFGWERVNYFDKESRRMGEDQRLWGWNKPPYFER